MWVKSSSGRLYNLSHFSVVDVTPYEAARYGEDAFIVLGYSAISGKTPAQLTEHLPRAKAEAVLQRIWLAIENGEVALDLGELVSTQIPATGLISREPSAGNTRIISARETETSLSTDSDTGGGKSPTRTVLVVDDDYEDLLLIEDMLNQVGWRTLKAVNGQQALILERDCNPDCIVLDINMPGMDGIETLERLTQQNPQVPVIIHTGIEVDRNQLLSRGAFAYVIKSSDMTELETRIHEALAITE